jgi:hypothetical protein
MGHTTIRVSEATRDTLRELARIDRTSMQDILTRALEEYRRKRFLEGVNDAYASLAGDAAAGAAYEAELRSLDGTLADGLDPEDWRSE